MRILGTQKRSGLRVALLVALIGAAFLIQKPDPTSAETMLTNGYFVGMGGEHRFDVHFEENGRLTISGEFGLYEGRWRLVGNVLCVAFEQGPRAGRNCEEITMAGPLSVRVGDRLFLAKLASALRLS